MNNNEYITISAFAKAVGTTNQAIYQQLNKRLKPYHKVIDNKKMLSTKAIEEIYNKEVDVDNQSTFQAENQELINQLNLHIKDLQEQLSVANADKQEKDKQIAYYQEENRSLREMAIQSQALHAGTIQTQLLSENNDTVSEQKKKNGIFAKIFRKGKVTDE